MGILTCPIVERGDHRTSLVCLGQELRIFLLLHKLTVSSCFTHKTPVLDLFKPLNSFYSIETVPAAICLLCWGCVILLFSIEDKHLLCLKTKHLPRKPPSQICTRTKNHACWLSRGHYTSGYQHLEPEDTTTNMREGTSIPEDTTTNMNWYILLWRRIITHVNQQGTWWSVQRWVI